MAIEQFANLELKQSVRQKINANFAELNSRLTSAEQKLALFLVPSGGGDWPTPESLIAAHPAPAAGAYAPVESTDTFWQWDTTASTWVNTNSSTPPGTVTVEDVTGLPEALLAKADKLLAFTALIDGSTINFNMGNAADIAVKVTIAGTPRTLAISNKPEFSQGLLKIIKNTPLSVTLNLDSTYTNKDRVLGDDILGIVLTGADGAHFLLSFFVDGNFIYWYYPKSSSTTGTEVSFASSAEAIAGTVADKAISPVTLKAVIEDHADMDIIEGNRDDLLTILESESGWSNSRKTITGQTSNGEEGQETFHSQGLYTYKCAGAGVWVRTPTADRVVGKISDATIISNIANTANWSNKAYIGPSITVYEGQYYRNADYYFISYADNTINRLALV